MTSSRRVAQGAVVLRRQHAVRRQPRSPAAPTSGRRRLRRPRPSRRNSGRPAARRARPAAPHCGASRVRPHQRVHRRRQQDRPVGRQQDGGGEIVGVAVRHLRHQVGGRGRDDDQVAIARKADVPGVELALRIEQVGVAALVGQRAGGERRDELLRGARQHAAHMHVPVLQSADQIERLVGGDAAADDQRHAVGRAVHGARTAAGCRAGVRHRPGSGFAPPPRRAG